MAPVGQASIHSRQPSGQENSLELPVAQRDHLHADLGIAGGAFLGLVQWLTLGLQVRGVGAWIAVSALGWSTSLGALAAVDLSAAGTVEASGVPYKLAEAAST